VTRHRKTFPGAWRGSLDFLSDVAACTAAGDFLEDCPGVGGQLGDPPLTGLIGVIFPLHNHTLLPSLSGDTYS
jgi:hypothetical protein